MARWAAVELAGVGGSAAWDFPALVVFVLAVASVAAALCAIRFRKGDKSRNTSSRSRNGGDGGGSLNLPACNFGGFNLPPKSPGRVLMKTLSSNKLFGGRKWGRSEEEEVEAYDRAAMEKGEFLWQRSILMGERCQPPDFPGLIIYDHMGNRLSEFPPKSPKLNLFHPSIQV